MKFSLAAVFALGAVSTLLAVTDGSPVPLQANALQTEECINDCIVSGYTGVHRVLARKRDELGGTLLHIASRGAGAIIKGPKAKEPAEEPNAAPVSFNGGSGGKTDSEPTEGLDGPILGRPDRDAGEGSSSQQPPPAAPAPVTASVFRDPEDEAVRQIGSSRQDDLSTAISTNRADNDKGSVESKGYVRVSDEQKGNTGPLHNESIDKGRYLDQFGLKATKDDNSKAWKNEVIKNRDDNDVEHISQYAVSVSERAIILKDSRNAQRDENLQPGGDESNIMKLRDMTVDSWRAAAGNADTVKDLKWIVRDDIGTLETRKAINAAFSQAGIDRQTKAVFTPTSTDPNHLAAYQQIAGSIHARGMVQMLADHHRELGNLEVAAFHVFTDGTTKRQKDRSPGTVPGYYSIVIELGRR